MNQDHQVPYTMQMYIDDCARQKQPSIPHLPIAMSVTFLGIQNLADSKKYTLLQMTNPEKKKMQENMRQ